MKPAKPSPDFPLYAHPNGNWAKKIKGKTRYFGPWDDAQAALERYLAETQKGPKVRKSPTVTHQPEESKTTDKPHPDFPLYKHGSGQWAKAVFGKTHYFGTDAKDALDRWLAEKDDLLAGRDPKREKPIRVELHELVNRYLSAKKDRVATGELSQDTYDQYEQDGKRLLGFFGRDAIIEHLGPNDFQNFRAAMGKTLGPVALGNAISRTRQIFTYGADTKLILPVDYGKQFQKPSSKTLRLERVERGEKLFSAKEIRDLLAISKGQVKAMILLGINCGFGNGDCGTLPLSKLDLEKGWHTYWRKKTGIPRRAPLWPETVAAIKDALAKRPKPRDKAHEDLVFITKRGNPWSKNRVAITLEFNKLLDKAGIGAQNGHSFYSLRRTFETVGEESMDQAGVSFIMGHVARTEDMAAIYRQKMTDERLLRVSNYVRGWLLKESLDNPVDGVQPSDAKATVDSSAAA